MSLRRFGIACLVFLFSLTVYFTVRIHRVTTDPAASMAGFFLFRAHRPSPTSSDNVESGGRTIPAFRLKDTVGRDVGLADFEAKKAIVVVFIGTECPLVNLYVLRLAELQREFGPRGVQI